MQYVFLKYCFILLLLFISCSQNNNPTSGETPAGTTNEILYITDAKLYIMNLETGEETFVTDSAYSRARWSPDGSWIAHGGPSRYEHSRQIYIVKPDGSGKRIVTLRERNGKIEQHPDGGYNFAWSPDGQRIAFDRCINCELGGLNFEIFIVDLDTSNGINEIRLTNNPYTDLVEDWYNDKLLIRSSLGNDGRYDFYMDLYEIDIVSLNRKHLFKFDSLSWGYGARYSPDGKKIAYIGVTPDITKTEIYIMNSDGIGVKKITDNYLEEAALSWSPDGKQLLFMAGSWGQGGQLYIINVDGTGLRKITSDSRLYLSPDWRPYAK